MSGLLLRRRGVIAASPADAGLFTDFSEYTADAHPSDWTRRLNTSGTMVVRADAARLGGKVLRHDGDGFGSDWQMSSWDVLDGSEDIEVVTLVPGNVGVIPGAGAIIRASADQGYMAGLRGGSADDKFSLNRITGASSSTEIGSHSITPDTNKWYWVRLQAIGTALKAKVWEQGTSEPGWQIQVTDSNHASGWAGVGWRRGASGAAWDVFGAALDGAEAPTA